MIKKGPRNAHSSGVDFAKAFSGVFCLTVGRPLEYHLDRTRFSQDRWHCGADKLNCSTAKFSVQQGAPPRSTQLRSVLRASLPGFTPEPSRPY